MLKSSDRREDAALLLHVKPTLEQAGNHVFELRAIIRQTEDFAHLRSGIYCLQENRARFHTGMNRMSDNYSLQVIGILQPRLKDVRIIELNTENLGLKALCMIAAVGIDDVQVLTAKPLHQSV